MRRLLTGLITLIAVAALVVPSRADDLLFDRLGDYFESLRIQAGIPGLSALIVGDSDSPLWERTFGQQDLERSLPVLPTTAFHLDGLTEVLSATMVLRCVEEGRLSLEDRVGRFVPDSPDAEATLRQILTHTSGPSDNLVFQYQPERLAPLAQAIATCRGVSFRAAVAAELDRLAMVDSVPGPDAAQLVPPAAGLTQETIARYGDVLTHLATPYAVDKRRHATPSQYTAMTLTPAAGLISTARDWARFDLALRQGILLRPETLAAAWQAPLDHNGQTLPHGVGWFVQSYNHEPVVWQFGLEDNASSSLVVTVPTRGLTLILLANSDGLVKLFELTAGDVTKSPFARVFLGLVVR
jgi:CubicO group peptidase (beta-lactamase class C family)